MRRVHAARLSVWLTLGALPLWSGCLLPYEPLPENSEEQTLQSDAGPSSAAVAKSPVEAGPEKTAKPKPEQPPEKTPLEEPREKQPAEPAAKEPPRDPPQASQLESALRMLASTSPEELQAARNQLFESPDAALPLLHQAARDENPVVVKNVLETLRVIGPAEAALPIMIEVLSRPEQATNWPDAIREIELTASPGAGEPLLKLALGSDHPEQRVAALSALGVAVDPPRETVLALLPMIFEDGPQLAAALVAANHALITHQQHDLLAGRGLGADVSVEQLQQLAALPERLSKIIAADSQDPLGEASRAAKMIAITTRQISTEPLTGIKILAFGGESDNGWAAAVLDGTWNTADRKTMWRHPVSQPGSIVFDLGDTRTVAGVRIWNFNESGGTHRGWKEVAVCVGSTPADLDTPVATGIVAQAPGKADSPDFSTTIPVAFIRGRYVRLQAQSVWRSDNYAGLAEVQILGF